MEAVPIKSYLNSRSRDRERHAQKHQDQSPNPSGNLPLSLGMPAFEASISRENRGTNAPGNSATDIPDPRSYDQAPFPAKMPTSSSAAEGAKYAPIVLIVMCCIDSPFIRISHSPPSLDLHIQQGGQERRRKTWH